MKIAIQPVSLFVPGKGTVEANLLEVRALVDLGVGASSFFDIQRRTITDEQVVDESFGLSGNKALTAEQYEAWTNDDATFCKAVALNLGLTPL